MRFLTESLFTRFTISSIANLVLTTDGFLQAQIDFDAPPMSTNPIQMKEKEVWSTQVPAAS